MTLPTNPPPQDSQPNTPQTPETRPDMPPQGVPPQALASVFDPQLFPSVHRPLRQWLADHNPCLLLSTVCMLLGCYLVNGALSGEPGNLKYLALLGVINLYEACIIPLGLILIRRTRGTARDGWWLLLFETLFLVNATLINPDFGPAWSIPLNLALWVLACIKVAVILRGLNIGLSLRTLGFFAFQLGILYGLPVVFALTKVDGEMPPRIMYALWWLVALLPVIYDQLARAGRPHPEWDLVQNVIRRVYLMAPWCMLVIHMRFSHWAHNSDFHLADAAPVLLGLAIAAGRIQSSAGQRGLVRLVPAMALLITVLTQPGELRWTVGLAQDAWTVVPGHIMLVATILTYGYMASMVHLLWTAVALLTLGTVYGLQSWILAILRPLARFLMSLVPTTVYAWGLTAILAAFVLLGVGTYLSLHRTRKAKAPA